MDRYKMLEGMDSKRALFGLFFAFDTRLQAAGDVFYEEITCKQFFLLICLYLFKDSPPTISELSEVMGSSRQNVKQIVNKLESNGFIKTYPDEKDRRKLRVIATEKMSTLSERYQAKEIEFLNRFYKNVSEEEIRDTFKTIQKIEGNLIGIWQDYKR